MRAYHVIAVAVTLAAVLGLKLFVFSAPRAEADVHTGRSAGMDNSRMHENRNLTAQAMHDMTFVYSDGD
jgi:hypothetical protein